MASLSKYNSKVVTLPYVYSTFFTYIYYQLRDQLGSVIFLVASLNVAPIKLQFSVNNFLDSLIFYLNLETMGVGGGMIGDPGHPYLKFKTIPKIFDPCTGHVNINLSFQWGKLFFFVFLPSSQ